MVLTVYRCQDFDEALERIQRLLDFQGTGHSCRDPHRDDESHAGRSPSGCGSPGCWSTRRTASATGGGFDNGLGFTLTMGAAHGPGNSISENLSYRHFLNTPGWRA